MESVEQQNNNSQPMNEQPQADGPVCADCKHWKINPACQVRPYSMPACQFFQQKPGRPVNPNKAPRLARTVNQPISQAPVQVQAPSQPISQAPVQVQAPSQYQGLNPDDLIPQLRPDIIRTSQFNKMVTRIDKWVKAKKNVALIGEAGLGKDQQIMAWCMDNKKPLIIYPCTGDMRKTDLLGQIGADANGNLTWIDGPLTLCVKHGWAFCADELNVVSSDITTLLHDLLAGGKLVIASQGQIIRPHPGFVMFATMNPVGYIGVRPVNQALVSRFQYVNVSLDMEVQDMIIDSLGLAMEVKTALVNLLDGIRGRHEEGQLNHYFGLRELASIQAGMNAGFSLLECLEDTFLNKLNPGDRPVIVALFNDLAGIEMEFGGQN